MILERFGTVTLPVYNPDGDIGPSPSRSGTVNIPGGAYDAYGNDQAPRETTTITRRCTLIEDTPAALQTALDELRSLRGKRDRLYARMQDDTVRWHWARLLRVVVPKKPGNVVNQEIELIFELPPIWWYGERTGDGWVLDAGEYFDAGLTLDESGGLFTLNTSPKNVTINNGGNATVTNAVITVTAAGTDITALTIAKSGETQLVYSGTIAVGQALVIDCGAWSVENNGSDDYANFALGASHAIEEWLHLSPGNNTITVTKTGGSAASTIGIEFYDGWE